MGEGMTELTIDNFFQERKETWLKKAINSSMTEAEVNEKEAEVEQLFSPEHWYPNAAKRADQISISTHPCTFSHPSARKNKNGYVSSIIAKNNRANDGYLRSGNVAVGADALGNAAALDVYKFLMLEMTDGKTLLEHLEDDSQLAQDILTIKSASYQDLRSGFLAMLQGNSENITSEKIKQIYFPVDDSYHQLSILTASGAVFELRKRIDEIRFSENTKLARANEKRDEIHESGYKQLVNITTIGYGGTKPQNISVLNSKNGGKAHLLSCQPPKIRIRNINFPTVDFFSQSLKYYHTKDLFHSLHAIFTRYKNDWHIRNQRDDYYQSIIDIIIEQMWSVRSVAKDQFNREFSQLNKNQKIWLCEEYQNERNDTDDWLDTLTETIARYIFNTYEKVLGKKAFMFSDAEFNHIHDQVEKNKEALR